MSKTTHRRTSPKTFVSGAVTSYRTSSLLRIGRPPPRSQRFRLSRVGYLEEKACATLHSNMDSLKTAFRREWEKIDVDYVSLFDSFLKQLGALTANRYTTPY
ncbi:hypothetical protein RB195_020944 [Necator americanus]|uniref:Uncharacterized protein n=1 Tax=Necator americanus TaxID=51031 RepID=A0ABR1CMQ5_NECAM